jgi:hypothetical protein
VKREVSRERKLPAFRIDVGQLEVLCERLAALFTDTRLHQSVRITFGKEEFDFDTPDEIRKCADLPSRVTSFRLSLFEVGLKRRVSLQQTGLVLSSASVSAVGETESWCAGAVETVYTFLNANRQWYWWVRGWPIGALALLSFNLDTVSRLLGVKPLMSSPLLTGAWLTTSLVFAALWFLRDRIFPAAVLEVRPRESTLRRYMPELTLFVAVLSLVLTIIGWFVGR